MKRHFGAAVLILLSVAAGPATQPAAPDYPALRKQLESLAIEVQRLTTENKSLRAALQQANDRLASLAPAVPQPGAVKPSSTYTDRASKYLEKSKGWRPVDKSEIASTMATAQAMDEKVAAYIAAHNVKPEIAAAMYEARPVAGMKESDLELILSPYRGSPVETLNSKEFTCSPADAGSPQTYRVQIVQGVVMVVARVDH